MSTENVRQSSPEQLFANKKHRKESQGSSPKRSISATELLSGHTKQAIVADVWWLLKNDSGLLSCLELS